MRRMTTLLMETTLEHGKLLTEFWPNSNLKSMIVTQNRDLHSTHIVAVKFYQAGKVYSMYMLRIFIQVGQ
jgi:hypothetical protein